MILDLVASEERIKERESQGEQRLGQLKEENTHEYIVDKLERIVD